MRSGRPTAPTKAGAVPAKSADRPRRRQAPESVMEIVLQWLDDLDDAVFTVVLAWERIRRRCLQIAAVSAAALAVSAMAAADLILPLATVAAVSALVGLLGAALAALAEAITDARRGV